MSSIERQPLAPDASGRGIPPEEAVLRPFDRGRRRALLHLRGDRPESQRRHVDRQETDRHGGFLRRQRREVPEAGRGERIVRGTARQALRERELVRRHVRPTSASSWSCRGSSTATCKQYAKDKGILYLCTICDLVSVEQMAPLDLPAYKVASRDLTNWPLLDALAQLRRPVVLSTGMAGERRSGQAVEIISRRHDQIVILQCTSEYPCPPEHVNLRAMQTYRKRYGLLVGMSDHTAGIVPAIAAAVMGACYVEKHITLSRAMRGTDHAGSLEMEGVRRLVSYIRQIETAMGDGAIDYKGWMGRARKNSPRACPPIATLPPATPFARKTSVCGAPASASPGRSGIASWGGGRCETFPSIRSWPRKISPDRRSACAMHADDR